MNKHSQNTCGQVVVKGRKDDETDSNNMMEDKFKVVGFFERLPFKIQYLQQMIQINA
jgi:hypothetical protein